MHMRVQTAKHHTMLAQERHAGIAATLQLMLVSSTHCGREPEAPMHTPWRFRCEADLHQCAFSFDPSLCFITTMWVSSGQHIMCDESGSP
jgi:hypothetical protein